MSEDLFPVPEVLSPKLAWLRKHGLTAERIGPDVFRCRNSAHTLTGEGQTEADAILDYCERHHLTHYSLES